MNNSGVTNALLIHCFGLQFTHLITKDNLTFDEVGGSAVAAPDHNIRQCIQMSALFPGRADGGSEGPERGAEGMGFGRGTGSPPQSPLVSLGALPRKWLKIDFKSAYFLQFC